MSINLKTYFSVETVVNNAQVVIGQRNVPIEQTLGGSKYDVTKTITNTSADNYNSDVLWGTGDGGMETFDTMIVIADAAALIEIQNDNADDIIFSLVADVPLILSADDLDVASLGADGSATSLSNLINQVTAKNNTDGSSADVAITFRLALFD